MADGKVVIDVDVNDKDAQKKVEGLGRSLDGAFQDKGGRWRSADGRFLTMKEKAVLLGKSIDDVGKSADATSKDMGTMGQKGALGIGKIVTALGLVKLASSAFNVLKSSIGGAVSRFDTLNNATRSFENMGFKTNDISKTMDNLKSSIEGLPTPLDGAVKGVQLLAGATGDIDKSQQVFSALNNGILGFGGTTDQVSNSVTQLSQALSNGRIDAETWNSMIDGGMGPALNALAKTFNMTTGEMKASLSDGTISVEQFQDGLINLDKNGGGGLVSLSKIAKDSTSGISTGVSNAKTAVIRGMTKIVSSINDSLKNANLGSIGEVIAKVGSSFGNALGKVAATVPQIISTIQSLYETIKPLLPVVVALGAGFVTFSILTSIATTIKSVTAAMTVFKTAQQASTIAQAALNAVMAINPFILIATAVIAAVAGLVYFFTQTKLGQTIVTAAWEAIKVATTALATFFTTVFTTIGNFFVTVWNGIKLVATTVWTAITTAVTTIVNVFVAMFLPIWQNLVATLTGIWNGIVAIAKGVWTIIKNVVLGIVLVFIDILTGNFTGLASHISQIWNNIKAATISIWNGIKMVITSVATGVKNAVLIAWNSIKSITTSVFNGIKSIALSVWNGIKSAVTGVVNGMKSAITSAWEGIKSATSNAFNAIKGLITGPLKSIDLFEIGKNIIQGLINGIGSMVHAVGEKITSIASGITGKIKGALGIHSPSRVMRDEVGKYIPQGIAVGIESDSNLIDKALTRAVSIPKITAESAANITPTYFGGTNSSRKQEINATGQNDMTDIIAAIREGGNRVINLVVDGKALAEVVSDYQGNTYTKDSFFAGEGGI